MKNIVWFALVSCLLPAACVQHPSAPGEKGVLSRDTTITPGLAFNDRFLDSLSVEKFITSEKLDTDMARPIRNFYNGRNYQFAWFGEKGLDEPGMTLLALLKGFMQLSRDSALFDAALLDQTRAFADGDVVIPKNPDTLSRIELGLTRQFLIYAKTAYAGKLDPEDLQWYIPRKKVDPHSMLDSLLATKDGNITRWEPLNPYYRSLRMALLRYDSLALRGGWPTLTIASQRSYKPGDTGISIAAIKQRLFLSGDLLRPDSSTLYDTVLSGVVRKLRNSFGLSAGTKIDAALAEELNVSPQQRIQQLLINLERMRWLPAKTDRRIIVANIPEYKLHVFDQGKSVLDMRIVVGQAGHHTVVFSNRLKYIVFSPYWNVPPSIVRNEILPNMKRQPHYLDRNRMEITGYSGGLPVIRQKPGEKNSLGLVKFLFPNEYNIYFHDTPAKSLFNRDERAFSHGCIRLAEPSKLAALLLKDRPEWTSSSISRAMHKGKEQWVTLSRPLPVYIVYVTAWVDKEGLLNFRKDIYGHDAEMATRLFIQSNVRP